MVIPRLRSLILSPDELDAQMGWPALVALAIENDAPAANTMTIHAREDESGPRA